MVMVDLEVEHFQLERRLGDFDSLESGSLLLIEKRSSIENSAIGPFIFRKLLV
jgi:hypothetical protein